MSVTPHFPVLFISNKDRALMSSQRNIITSHVIVGDISILGNFTDEFTVISYSLAKKDSLHQLSMTLQKIGGHGLLNTTFNVG